MVRRLAFEYAGDDYQLRITDPGFLSKFWPRIRGMAGTQRLALENVSVCVSLGNAFDSRHYKLVAGIVFSHTGIRLWTVGHSNRAAGELIDLLQENDIEAVADVRSHPGSHQFPHFSRRALHASLRDAGIHYGFLGDELGARHRLSSAADPFGDADGDLTETPEFSSGLRRLIAGTNKFRIAILCAEKDPLLCHRTILICRNLWREGFEIHHIVDEGRVESHAQAESRLLLEENVRPEQQRLFAESSTRVALDLAYDRRWEKISYRGNDETSHRVYDRIHAEDR